MVQRMLSALCSIRRPSVSARTANFVALYTVPPGAQTLKPATEAMLMMWPSFCFCMIGSTAATPYEALDVHIDHSIPFFDLERRHRCDGHDPGIVHDRVDSAMKYIVESMSGGVGLFDCDNDGRLDIVVVNGSTI